MSDFREYAGVDFLVHYGVGHDKGGHSGRYPWGSGENGKQGERSGTNGFPKSTKATKRDAYRRLKRDNGQFNTVINDNGDIVAIFDKRYGEYTPDDFAYAAKRRGRVAIARILATSIGSLSLYAYYAAKYR